MSKREKILFPVGRLVQGSLYEPQREDAENKPLTYKTGANLGQPRVTYYFGFAIPKGTEKHWAETDWGKVIWATGHAGFPQGQASAPTFAWKIKDGDSTIPNKVGKKPCDSEGFPGNWILNFSSGFAPGIVTEDGTQQLTEVNFVNLGDFIQVFGSVADNESMQQPGVYLNHELVAFRAYGERIILGTDAKTVGFGKAALPPGAMATPPAAGFNPASTATPPPAAAAVPPPPVVPHTEILNPAPATHVMTAKAEGATYEQLIAAGWTDLSLKQNGMMEA